MSEINLCNDDNQKVIEIEFDTGSLKKQDIWKLCAKCKLIKKFQKFRIKTRNLGENNN